MAGYGVYPSPQRVWIGVPFVLLALGTALGVGAWLAALNVKYRDVRYVVPFLLQLWLFATPVFISFDGLNLASRGRRCSGSTRWPARSRASAGRCSAASGRSSRRSHSRPSAAVVLLVGGARLLPAHGADLCRHRLSTRIEIRDLGKRYRLGERTRCTGRCATRSSRRALRAAPARGVGSRTRGDLGARRRLLRRRARRGPRDHRPQRRRQDHAAEDPLAHHRADRGRGAHLGPRRLPARGRHRLPPRADRPRERLPQRRDPRMRAARSTRSSTRSSRSPRSSGSSTRRSSATRAACTCGSRSPSPRTSSRRS